MDTTEDTTATPSYKLSLAGEGITLERELTKDVALAVINVALGGSPTVAPPVTGGGSQAGGGVAGAPAGDSRQTPGEFIEEVEARTNVDKIIAFGVYLQDHRQSEDFSRDDIKGMFRAAHESPPGNFPRDFRAALTGNGIAEEGSTERYYVTKTGRKAVEDRFKTSRPARRGGRRGRTAAADDES